MTIVSIKSWCGALGSVAVLGCSDGAARDESADGSGESLYAMMVQVYDAEDRTVYAHLSHTLDLASEVDLSQAREFPSVANFAPVGGRLLVSSGIEPAITEFDIGEDLSWSEGDTVSFANFPFEDNANFYYQYILDEHTAYMPFDVTKRLIWDPTNMTIDATLEDSSLPLERDGLKLRVGGNRNAIHFEGPVQQAFFFTDDDWFVTGPESLLAFYDEQTHEEAGVVTLPCPGLSMASQDEQGYTYYGTWGFQGTLALFGEGPQPCVARLKPDLTLDEAWTTDLKDLTDGRYSNNFRYIGGGKAIANVLLHERIQADWTAGYDQDVADAIDASGDHWQFWLFDLEKWQASPIEGIDAAISSGAQFAVLDGRTFLFLPYDEWSHTKIYELGDDGKATVLAGTVGDVFKWVRVR
jgi:hypothetical protein